jgi:hypothetical protein
MKKSYEKAIKNATSVSEMFGIVRELVKEYSGYERKYISINTKDLGYTENLFVGAYYNYYANTITINEEPLVNLANYDMKLFKFYLFHILLHEYIHALGVMNEFKTRALVYQISKDCFGENHPLTEMAVGLEKFIPVLKPSMEEIPIDAFFSEYAEILDRIFESMLNFEDDM